LLEGVVVEKIYILKTTLGFFLKKNSKGPDCTVAAHPHGPPVATLPGWQAHHPGRHVWWQNSYHPLVYSPSGLLFSLNIKEEEEERKEKHSLQVQPPELLAQMRDNLESTSINLPSLRQSGPSTHIYLSYIIHDMLISFFFFSFE
jgi:hypothetical protein